MISRTELKNLRKKLRLKSLKNNIPSLKQLLKSSRSKSKRVTKILTKPGKTITRSKMPSNSMKRSTEEERNTKKLRKREMRPMIKLLNLMPKSKTQLMRPKLPNSINRRRVSPLISKSTNPDKKNSRWNMTNWLKRRQLVKSK